ncbi:hypothetical protein [Myroides sp. DF42-4-2]|uniref:hypothetical protein n=1 Tax=Myroides sp. DF42-4-2 TaxID=2746726 RepID=UPI0025763A5A|nr:hypothetical protein [Myroides sp. DF42-4-2]MDM1406191.1 hypothetical protein [Myroides sp. DF42-4-2]
MKKITLLAAVLGASYFANAQVGIGTPTPITSTQLDVTAKDKGILIPRVALTSIEVFKPIEGAQTESLLVYNSNGVAIPTGFYYWVDSKWNRIVGKAELDQVIENLGDNITNLEADVKNLQAVINYILPSNPSNDDTTPETHTTVVYKDGKFYTVTYDATTQTYTTQEINFEDLVNGAETKTFMREISNAEGKVIGVIYFSEQTILDWLEAADVNTVDNIPNTAPGATTIKVTDIVVNNIQEILESPTTITITTVEGDKTFTTVEEYLQYITQFSNGNVIYSEIEDPANPGQTIWAFQYWDEAANKYQIIDIQGLVEAAETNTTIVSYNNKQYYLSESYIKAGGETNPANWTSVPAGAIHVDVVGGVVNNIQEILEKPTNITITTVEGDKTFTTVEEYLQYISQYSNGNVIYTEIADPANAGQTMWVFQYWDEATNSYETINLRDLVAATETKTQIKRSEVVADGTLPAFEAVRTAPVAGDVKQGEIFYEYSAEGDQKDYINMTEDILNSINNNEEIKNAITNVLNQGGNVYFGDHDGDDNKGNAATPHVFYQVITNPDGTKTNKEIELPASFLVNLIKKYKDIIKQELGDHITNEGDTVYTGDTYNGYKVYLGKGATTIVAYSAEATPVTLTLENGVEIRQVLSIKLLTAAGHIVTSNTTDVVINGTEINFNIGVGNQYMMLTPGTYEVVVEFTSNEEVQL